MTDPSPPHSAPLTFVVLCPHFDPDTAPTGVVMTRIVRELAARGHRLHVVTSLPWYRNHRVEAGWTGPRSRVETTPWGTITRVHPFASPDKRNLVRRALGFAGFSALVGWKGLGAGDRRRVDCVLAMSPPLTLGMTGWLVHLWRRGPLVFNVQDIFPDAAVETGAISTTSPAGRLVVGAAGWLERLTYRRSAAVTVLSDDLRDNVAAKLPRRHRHKVRVIPNFVDIEAIRPGERATAYRRELGIGDEPVVLYAGNVGFSQSLDLVIGAARRLPRATFVIHGEGSAKEALQAAARDVPNVRFSAYLPPERLPEVLASGDVHVVPLRAGLGSVSVPSKTYSILAAGRPVVAAIDPGTEVPRMLAAAGAGSAVPPDDLDAFTDGLRALLDDPARARAMGEAGRRWVEQAVSPAAVAEAYERVAKES
jgi:colanic acid biosynthesis glycosyl transferase WcaI